jgi:uncharacterized membrane protein YccC
LPGPEARGWRARLAARDPGTIGLARAVRVTLVGPAVFALALEGFDNAAFATMAVFGATAALVFADFGGPLPSRVRAYGATAIAGAALLAVGTLASGSTPWNVGLALVLVTAIRFAGNLGPRYAAAVSTLILAFMLGALVPAPVSAIPGRVAGWIVGVALATVAAVFVMPARSSVRIERIAADAATELAKVLRAALTTTDADVRQSLAARVADVRASLRPATLMPVRPSGPGVTDVARRQILDRVTSLSRVMEGELRAPAIALSAEMTELGEQAAACLEASAHVLRGELAVGDLGPRVTACDHARAAALERVRRSVASDEGAEAVLDRVDAGFIARAGAWHCIVIARNTAFLAGDRALARGDVAATDLPEPTAMRVWQRLDRFLGEYAIPSSVWFRDALRAGAALAAAVLLARSLGVDHAFWVALGTLSVLRSNALATGQSAVAASLGTGLGFAVSSGVLAVVGLHTGALWFVFAVSIFFVGYLPGTFGFVAGQAAFTVFVVALFNLVEPLGWHTGLARLEDVVLGAGVSAAVALLFWPRRLEPLVARLTAEVSRHAGALLASTAAQLTDDRIAVDRTPTVQCEARARAALIELLDQYRRRPALAEPWVARLGVALHARAASDALVRLPELVPVRAPATGDPDGAVVAFGDELCDAATLVQADLAPGRGHGDRPRAPRIETSTRAAALAAVAAADGDAPAVVRAVLARDWIVGVAQQVDHRP